MTSASAKRSAVTSIYDQWKGFTKTIPRPTRYDAWWVVRDLILFTFWTFLTVLLLRTLPDVASALGNREELPTADASTDTLSVAAVAVHDATVELGAGGITSGWLLWVTQLLVFCSFITVLATVAVRAATRGGLSVATSVFGRGRGTDLARGFNAFAFLLVVYLVAAMWLANDGGRIDLGDGARVAVMYCGPVVLVAALRRYVSMREKAQPCQCDASE